MRIDTHLTVVAGRVRGHALPSVRAAVVTNNRVYALSEGLTSPRLWGYATGAVLDGFREGVLGEKVRKPALQLDAGFMHARGKLLSYCDSLIEREAPDATLLGLIFERDEVQVLSAGACRAYVEREGKFARLTPRDDPETGVLRARPARGSEDLQAGDLVMAGSPAAFSQPAVDRVKSVLNADPTTQPAVIASLLVEPARESGYGAAVLCARVL